MIGRRNAEKPSLMTISLYGCCPMREAHSLGSGSRVSEATMSCDLDAFSTPCSDSGDLGRLNERSWGTGP